MFVDELRAFTLQEPRYAVRTCARPDLIYRLYTRVANGDKAVFNGGKRWFLSTRKQLASSGVTIAEVNAIHAAAVAAAETAAAKAAAMAAEAAETARWRRRQEQFVMRFNNEH